MGCLRNIREGYSPITLRLSQQDDESLFSNQKAKQGHAVHRPTSGTLEFRFLPAVESGEEIEKINRLLMHWLDSLHQDQLHRTPITYRAYDPRNNKTRWNSRQLEQAFFNFVKKIGLSPSAYKVFHRQGCQPPYRRP